MECLVSINDLHNIIPVATIRMTKPKINCKHIKNRLYSRHTYETQGTFTFQKIGKNMALFGPSLIFVCKVVWKHTIIQSCNIFILSII